MTSNWTTAPGSAVASSFAQRSSATPTRCTSASGTRRPSNYKSNFAHELTHVWQLYHFPVTWYGWHALTDHVLGDDAGSYAYTLVDGKDFGDYGLEEQAAIVQASVGDPSTANAKAAELVAHTFKSATWKLMIGSSGC